MASAFAVVMGRSESRHIVVVQHDMLAFVADDIRNTIKILRVFGDDKSARD